MGRRMQRACTLSQKDKADSRGMRTVAAVDALSYALNAVRMTGAIFFNAEFSAPWGFTSPEPAALTPLLAQGTGRVLMFHLVLEGEAQVRIAGKAEASLTAGDIVILSQGDAHAFSNGSPLSMLDTTSEVFGRLGSDLSLTKFGGGGATTRFICGYFGCERSAERLFLAGLPPIVKTHVRKDSAGEWLEQSIRHLAGEAGARRPGHGMLVSKMAEALFIEALRRYTEELTAEQTGWLAAAKDPVVGRAIALLHRDPRHAWSVAELAAQAGASRAVLAERFTHLLGEPPLSYLARWRLQLAARLLETTRNTMVQVAGEVGYESETAFSRAFSREFGSPPARYRRQREAQQGAVTA
jgi:AraC-like DNA-binding protein